VLQWNLYALWLDQQGNKMWLFNLIVGSRVQRLVAGALGVLVVLFGAIQFGRQKEKTKQKVQNLKAYKETREKIDEVEVNTDRDAALDRLRDNDQLR